MSITEAHAIGELHHSGPATQQRLAPVLRLLRSTVSRLVDQREADGIATREPIPTTVAALSCRSPRWGRAGPSVSTTHAEPVAVPRLLDELDAEEGATVVAGLSRLNVAADGLA
jgi:hypothetical protein